MKNPKSRFVLQSTVFSPYFPSSRHKVSTFILSASHKSKSNSDLDQKTPTAVPASENDVMDMTEHRCDICCMSFKFDSQLRQHLKSKSHVSKVNDKLSSRSETQPVTSQANDFSLVIPLSLDQSFVEQQHGSMVDARSTKFNDEDLINLADNNSFLDDNNVQLIV